MKPEKILPKRISRALEEFDLISEGDSVLLALSGGKDSLALAYFLARMAPSWIRPFSVEAVHVKAPWEGEALSDWIRETCRRWEIPCAVIPLDESPVEKKMTCALCSRYRRKALLTYAAEKDFSTIALGHHMEDCLETFLMNLVYQSRIDPLLPRRDYPGQNLALIRPLVLAQENIIARWAQEEKLTAPGTDCPWESRDSRRREMRLHLEGLTEGSATKKHNMFRALSEDMPRT